MENFPGTGKRLNPEELASLLRQAANEVEAIGSFEGSIAWETPTTDFDRRFEVIAFFRVGQQLGGQGGAVVVRGDG